MLAQGDHLAGCFGIERSGVAQFLEQDPRLVHAGALLLGAAGHPNHGGRDFAARRCQLFAHRAEVGGAGGNVLGFPGYRTDHIAQAGAHVLHGQCQAAQLGGHGVQLDRSQVARAKPVRGLHQLAQRAIDGANGAGRCRDSNQKHNPEEQPERVAAAGGLLRQVPGALPCVNHLGSSEGTHVGDEGITGEAGSLRRAGGFFGPAKVSQRMGPCVVDLDGGLGGGDAVEADPVGGAEPAQLAIAPLEGVGGITGIDEVVHQVR